MQSVQRLEIAVRKDTVEAIINAELGLFLRGAGLIRPNELVRINLPVGETFMLPLERMQESDEERLVLHIL